MTAILHGNLEEEIYMSQLTGFKTAGKENMVLQGEEIVVWIKTIS